MFNLSINQAISNMQILHQYGTFTTDGSGNLNYISEINYIGRLIYFIKNKLWGSQENKVNEVILATFETINEYANNNPGKPIWTYGKDYWGKEFKIGFDKVVMKILVDNWRFGSNDKKICEIRKVAYAVLLIATEQRKKNKIGFDCDHEN